MLENIVQNAHCDEMNSTAMVCNHVYVHIKFGKKKFRIETKNRYFLKKIKPSERSNALQYRIIKIILTRCGSERRFVKFSADIVGIAMDSNFRFVIF